MSNRPRPISNGMNGSPFQYVIMGIFVVLLVGGIVLFALFGGATKSGNVGKVVIWGTVDSSLMQSVIGALITDDVAFQEVSYVQKKPETYEADLVQAFASGKAPDLFMVNDTQIVSFKDKVSLISYKSVSERTFGDTFANEGSLFMFPEGIMGLPMVMDPLVMYWNKDLFAGAGLATYPRAWSEISTIAPKMTAIDTAKVKRSAVALGTYDNVRYAKEIMSALIMQVGNPIVSIVPDRGFVSSLGDNQSQGIEGPGQASVRFYTGFSNSAQSNYSWNRALPNSFNAFISGDLGIYFGLASDYQQILARNPNLAFGVALLPQTGAAKAPLTYGRVTALSIPRGAPNPSGALYIAQALTTAKAETLIAGKMGLAPARRDLLASEPADAAQSVFYQSALMSRGWYDPGASISGPIIKSMIESTISGKLSLNDAVIAASLALDDAFANVNQQ